MPSPRFTRLLGRPTIGGWLTIINCSGQASVWILISSTRWPHGQPIEYLATTAVIIFSLPFGCCVMMPPALDDYGTTLPGIIVKAVVIGLNSIVWGYGLARFTRNPAWDFARRVKPDRGFPVTPHVVDDVDEFKKW